VRGIPFCSWQFSTKIVNQENISHLIEVSENVYLNVVFNSQNMGSSLFLDYLWDVVSFLKKLKMQRLPLLANFCCALIVVFVIKIRCLLI